MGSLRHVIRLALFAMAIAASPLAHSGEPIDVVFDLDWTSLYTSTPESVLKDGTQLIEHAGKQYRISDHLVEALLRLHQTPDIRVSFFSGGDFERNTAVIEAIYERVNRLAGQPGRYAPFRMRHAADLTHVANPPAGARFPDRFKKDLLRVDQSVRLDRAVLIDDIQKFALPGQEKNFLWLKDTYDDVPDFDAWAKSANAPKLRFPPPSREAWALERNKIAWALGSVLEARDRSQATGRAFVDCLDELTRDSHGAPIAWSEASQLALTRRGLREMGLPELPLERITALPRAGGGCAIEVRALLQGIPALRAP